MLVKQLVMAKRDNVRYKDDLAQLKDNISNEESEKQKKKYPHQLNRQQTGNSEANVSFVFTREWKEILREIEKNEY